MTFAIRDIVRSISERARLYMTILLIAIAAFLILQIVAFAIAALSGTKTLVLPTLLVLAMLGLLSGILVSRFAPDIKYELKSEGIPVVIIAGAIVFAALNALFTLYTLTVGSYSIFASMPLIQVNLMDMLSKLAVAIIDGFIKGLVLFAAIVLGSSI